MAAMAVTLEDMAKATAARRTVPFDGGYHLRQSDDEDKYRIVIAAEDMGVDLSRMDVTTRYANNPIVLFNHDPFTPIGRTIGVPRYEGGRWIAEFVFAEGDAQAQRIRNLYDQRIINSASIGFDILKDADGREYPLLVEWSVVYAGLDKSALALRQLDATLTMLEEQHMITTETQEREAEAEVAEEISADEAIAALEEATAEAAEAETAEAQVEEPAAEVDADDERLMSFIVERDAAIEDKITERLEQLRAEERELARLEVRAADMLPAGFDAQGASKRELLLAICGDEVADAEQRSDDYLHGRADAILERRSRGVQVSTQASAMMGQRSDRPRSIRDLIHMANSEDSNGYSN